MAEDADKWPEWRVDFFDTGKGATFVCGFARLEYGAVVMTRARLAARDGGGSLVTPVGMHEPKPHPDEPLPAWTVVPLQAFATAQITYIGEG